MALSTRGALYSIREIVPRVKTGASTALARSHSGALTTLHTLGYSYTIKDTVSSSQFSTVAANLNTQIWMEWKDCYSKDARIESRASPLAHGQAVNYIREGYMAAIENARRQPTESEEDVVADRSDEDPLPPLNHHTIRLPAGEAGPNPTESEEDVTADRSDDDPLRPGDHRTEGQAEGSCGRPG